MQHGLLEHLDRARQRADLVAPFTEWNMHGAVAGGDRFGHAGDIGDRPGDAAPDDDAADRRQQHRETGEQRKQCRHPGDAFVHARVDLLRPIGIVLAQRRHSLAERFAHGRRIVLCEPGARGLGALLVGDLRERERRVAHVADAHRELAEIARVVIADAEPPFGQGGADLVVGLAQRVGVVDRGVMVLRHCDGTCFDRLGKEQAVDAHDVPAPGIGGFEGVGARHVQARAVDGDRRQRQRRGGHQCKDRIELCGNRKLRQCYGRSYRRAISVLPLS